MSIRYDYEIVRRARIFGMVFFDGFDDPKYELRQYKESSGYISIVEGSLVEIDQYLDRLEKLKAFL